jgi:hypothetical protein
MYVQVPEIVSHAQRKLIGLIEERRFTATARSYGLTASNIALLYRMAVGKIQPSFVMIFNLRGHIAPAEWFYDETEKLPGQQAFHPKYACFDRRARQHFIRYPTPAVAYLEGLFREGKLQVFCGEEGLTYAMVYGYAVKRKRPDGITGYHARPGYGVIRKLREKIPPEHWFIFPEEAEAAFPEERRPDA